MTRLLPRSKISAEWANRYSPFFVCFGGAFSFGFEHIRLFRGRLPEVMVVVVSPTAEGLRMVFAHSRFGGQRTGREESQPWPLPEKMGEVDALTSQRVGRRWPRCDHTG